MKRCFETSTDRARRCPRIAPSRGRYRYVRRRWRVLFGAIDAVGCTASAIAGLLARVAGVRRGDAWRDPEAILLVQLDHLGDAVISLVLIDAVRRRYPAARFEVLASARNAALFRASSAIDRVHVCRHTRFDGGTRGRWMASLLAWGWRLRRRRFDLAIDPRGEFPHAVVMWLACARRRLGYASGGGGCLLTDRVPWEPGRHEVESRLALVEPLNGIDRDRRGELAVPRFDPGYDARSRAAERLRRDRLGGRRSMVVMHPGAGTEAKRWPTAHWRALIEIMLVRHDVDIVLVGRGGEDRRRAAEITAGMTWQRVRNWTDELTVTDLAAVIERGALFVGCDSGPAHLAAAVGTPVVVLFSGTNDARQWRPRGCHVEVVRVGAPCAACHRNRCWWSDHPCMTRLTPAIVLGAADRLWREVTLAEHPKRYDVRPGVASPAHGSGYQPAEITAGSRR